MLGVRVLIWSSVTLYGGLLALFGPFSNDFTVLLKILSYAILFDVFYSFVTNKNSKLDDYVKKYYWNFVYVISILSVIIGFKIGTSDTEYFWFVQRLSVGMGLDDPSLYDQSNKNLILSTYTVPFISAILCCVIMRPRYKRRAVNTHIPNKKMVIAGSLCFFAVFAILFLLDFSGRTVGIRRAIDSSTLKILIYPWVVSITLISYQYTLFAWFLGSKTARRAFHLKDM
jgi:hypothetical protein